VECQATAATADRSAGFRVLFRPRSVTCLPVRPAGRGGGAGGAHPGLPGWGPVPASHVTIAGQPDRPLDIHRPLAGYLL